MTAALIIAAGKTERRDKFSPEKQVGRITAIERIVLLFKLAGIQRIVVVGDEDELPQKLVSSMNLVFLTVSANGEMLDSIKQGLLYLRDKCTKALITHADVPVFSKNTVQLLLDADGDVCIPSHGGRCGHPILLRSTCFAEIISYRGNDGLKGAIEASGIKKEIVETDDEGILIDVQSPTLHGNLLDNHDIMNMRASFQIKISKEKRFYGPGVHHLLQLIEEFGSLSSACQHMGMSYTKGRKIISTMEEQLGVPVLDTKQGGKTGGYSRLTEEAKKMMDSYFAFQEEAEAVLQKIFKKHFT
ncbi:MULTISPECIES: NTP transferase domain-containing protein [unclassified Sedimentibacter]|uniref:NTP transferase domain-containing protein n=1 Tax=unclassified Sedimentibacter TaxID=2649220 RepID=UPI0027DFC99B|nr:NTP transferase domain-containing protein [Sedimentibacter sp. MB35-C1]WMJ78057.1 NTP transferase domain-containing protein [Sedimentibacter sp. MB35-C1]